MRIGKFLRNLYPSGWRYMSMRQPEVMLLILSLLVLVVMVVICAVPTATPTPMPYANPYIDTDSHWETRADSGGRS